MRTEKKETPEPMPGISFAGNTPEGYFRYNVDCIPNKGVNQNDLEQLWRWKEMSKPGQALELVLQLLFSSMIDLQQTFTKDELDEIHLLTSFLAAIVKHDLEMIREDRDQMLIENYLKR